MSFIIQKIKIKNFIYQYEIVDWMYNWIQCDGHLLYMISNETEYSVSMYKNCGKIY